MQVGRNTSHVSKKLPEQCDRGVDPAPVESATFLSDQDLDNGTVRVII